MTCGSAGRAAHPQRVEVLESARVYEGFISLDRALVCYERFDGTMSAPASRLVAERGDAVGVLLYDAERDEVVLVEQFRYPAYSRGEQAWLLEIVAGTCPLDQDPLEVARREVREEAGYEVQALEHLGSCFLSPGGSTERVHIYQTGVAVDVRTWAGGGVPGEGEDTRLCIVPREEALGLVRRGAIADAKTIIALLAMHGGS
ncbi:MAG TPA: NUDIX domain-containing protein [Anaerolineae bacterium]|nr:NUDIX domain-containing protein [Anaerolineae bacterium]HOQ98738.1 NUDIX domain-containing protein [Anaerolineae bacterium]HPL28321.1 NUDIX domain-containing protein [Anaerolineae bacterium]